MPVVESATRPRTLPVIVNAAVETLTSAEPPLEAAPDVDEAFGNDDDDAEAVLLPPPLELSDPPELPALVDGVAPLLEEEGALTADVLLPPLD